MAVGQAFVIACPQAVVSSGNSQQPAVLWGTPLSRMESTLRLARPLCSSTGFGHSGSCDHMELTGLTSSFCMLQCFPYIKPGRKDSTTLGKLWQRRMHQGRFRCQLGGASSSQEDEIGPDANVPSTSGGNDTVQFDLNLPRRSLLLEFTCNVCNARTQRMINPDAFRRGTVYVQCGGCEAYHQLVDNLNLVEEYNFKTEADPLRNDLGV